MCFILYRDSVLRKVCSEQRHSTKLTCCPPGPAGPGPSRGCAGDRCVYLAYHGGDFVKLSDTNHAALVRVAGLGDELSQLGPNKRLEVENNVAVGLERRGLEQAGSIADV